MRSVKNSVTWFRCSMMVIAITEVLSKNSCNLVYGSWLNIISTIISIRKGLYTAFKIKSNSDVAFSIWKRKKTTKRLYSRLMLQSLRCCLVTPRWNYDENNNQANTIQYFISLLFINNFLRQESLYYNLIVYVVGGIFTSSIVAYAVYQTYQVDRYTSNQYKEQTMISQLFSIACMILNICHRTAGWQEMLYQCI